MSFTKEKIKPKYVWILDIWSYKIRVWICKILNRDVELVWYGEKRQDMSDINLQEIKNLESVCKNISLAISKAESDAKLKITELITNIPTPHLFFEISKINYIREEKKQINDNEFLEIIKEIQRKALKSHYKTIKNTTWYNKSDLKLIISNISNILVDGTTSKKITWTDPKEINISITNIFLTEAKYEMIKYIEKYLWKKISKIMPSEFAIISLFKKRKNVVIIDLWNSHTSIVVKKEWSMLWAKKLNFWINDFIKEVRKKHNLTKSDIISKIDENIFEIEKLEFLEIFKDIIAITLSDIVKKDVCPHNFFVFWWWANKFIKNYLEITTFDSHDLKIAKKINFIAPKIDFIDDKITENPSWIDWAKSNINIYAMIKTTLNFIKKDKNKIEKTLKKAIGELEK